MKQHRNILSRLLFWLFVGVQCVFTFQATAQDTQEVRTSNCRDVRLKDEFSQKEYLSEWRPAAKVNIEQQDYHQTYKDIVSFQPGHQISLAIDGQIDINRRYWSVRKCKWLGLKCWYEPRESSNWQGIEDRPVLARLCLPDEQGACVVDLSIKSGSYDGLKKVRELQVEEGLGLESLTKRYELQTVIEGNGVDRSECTGVRPSSCSFGEYEISTVVDVKDRVLELERLLQRPQKLNDLLGDDVVGNYIRRSNVARKIVACLYFEHAQLFYPEVVGGANRSREQLLRFIIELDPDNEYRVELTGQLIESGALDEALEGAEEQLIEARKAYEESGQRQSEAEAYAKTLLNRARLWIDDRVASEGADLDVAVGLLSELVRVRRASLVGAPWDEARRVEFIRAQIEQARLLSLIRSSVALEQAEKGLSEAQEWVTLDKSEEVVGGSEALGIYASYSRLGLQFPEGQRLDGLDESTAAPKGSVYIHRVPSWSARTTALRRLGRRHAAVWLSDDLLNEDGMLWYPDAGQAPTPWRLLGSSEGCRNAKNVRYLGGSATGNSTHPDGHTLFFLDSNDFGDSILVLQLSHRGGECVRIEPWRWAVPSMPSEDSVTEDASPVGEQGSEPAEQREPTVEVPKPEDPLTVDIFGRLIYAKGKRVYALDTRVDTIEKISVKRLRTFNGTVQRIVASSDDESIGFVILDRSSDGQQTKNARVFRSLYDVEGDGVPKAEFTHSTLRDGGELLALSSTLAFVHKRNAIDVLNLTNSSSDSNRTVSESDLEVSINLDDSNNGSVFIHALEDDFAVLRLHQYGGKHYGYEKAWLFVRIRGFHYETSLSTQDAEGFKGGVVLDIEADSQDPEDGLQVRFRVGVFASGVNGVLHSTTLDRGLRLSTVEAAGLTSERVEILRDTALRLSTRVVKVSAGSGTVEGREYRNVPVFDGREVEEISQFCVQHSDWGCRVAVLAEFVPKEAEGKSGECWLQKVSDPILLIAVGRGAGGKMVPSSDVVARVRVGCDDKGQPRVRDGVELLSDEFPEVATLEAEFGEEYSGPVWRHVGSRGKVLPETERSVFASLPHEVLDLSEDEFGDRSILRVPVRLVGESDTLIDTVAIRSPYGVRHILVRVDADGTVDKSALVVAEHPERVVGYVGGAEKAIWSAGLPPRQLVQAIFATDGKAILLGKLDLKSKKGELVRIEGGAAQEPGFAVGAQWGINAEEYLAEWIPKRQIESHMQFEFFGSTRNLDLIWYPDGLCTLVERADGRSVATLRVGRPASISHLRYEGEAQPIVIQRARLEGEPKPGLRLGLPFTQFWRALNAGARGAC